MTGSGSTGEPAPWAREDNPTLEQVEGDIWGEAPFGSTRLVERIHQLRRRPIASLGAEDLRLLLTQEVGTQSLLPRALDLLEQDPLIAGDFYPGDLLVAVARSATQWAGRQPELAERWRVVLLSVDPGDVDVPPQVRALLGD